MAKFGCKNLCRNVLLHTHIPPPLPTYRDVVALSDRRTEKAGHHATDIQEWHSAAPAVLLGRLTLHAGEAPHGTAAYRWRRGEGGLVHSMFCKCSSTFSMTVSENWAEPV